MVNDPRFWLKFWGVRGTIPTPGPSTLCYGGNTSCVEVQCGSHRFILDAGSGIKALGDTFDADSADILLSHTHIDHVLGLPNFAPFYDSEKRFRLWAGHLGPNQPLRSVVDTLMSPPLFPLTPDAFKAQVDYRDFIAGDLLEGAWEADGVRITTFLLSHPDRATGYRIEYGGQSLCYITDYEHVEGEIDSGLVNFVRRSNCLIYDATYSDEEFARFKGWGHSTWQQAVRLSEAAGVGTLALFHHDPDATDAILHQRAAEADAAYAGAVVAMEGMTIHLIEP